MVGLTTPTLDDFSRPNESPLSNQGRWSSFGTGTVRISALAVNTTTSLAGAYWNPQTFTDFEAHNIIGGETPGIVGRLSAPGANWNGYLWAWGDPSFGAVWTLSRYDAGVQTVLFHGAGPGSPTTGDTSMLRGIGANLECWAQLSGVWSLVAAVSDATYQSGNIGIWFPESFDGMGPFGGGAYPPSSIQPSPMSVSGALRT